MSNLSSSRYAEIVVRLIPMPLGGLESSGTIPYASTTSETRRVYYALVYTDLDLPAFKHAQPEQASIGQPEMIAGLPLVAVEEVAVRWSRYQEYLALFIEGEKDPYHLARRLFDTLSPGLEYLFSGQLATAVTGRPVRLWWSSETPELNDLPWELAVYAAPSTRSLTPGNRLFLVRGTPPDTIPPLVPVEGPLRLAFIHNPRTTRDDSPIRRALGRLPLHLVKVMPMDGPPRQALQTAVREGYELVHLVADGIVSLAYEGILYVNDSYAPRIPPSELSRLLLGSRVTVLSLAPPEVDDPDQVEIGGRMVPSAYRAYAYLGGSRLPLPTIVAPLGPFRPERLEKYWYNFYTGLAESLAIDEAVARGMSADDPYSQAIPIALFLRHFHTRLFRRVGTGQTRVALEDDPTQMSAQLQVSLDAVNQLNLLKAQYGALPAGVEEYLAQQSAHQTELEERLEQWTQLEGDES